MRADDLDTNFKTIVNTLIDSLDEKEKHVGDAIKKSLCKIANTQNADTVLLVCCEYCSGKKKIQNEHIANILSTVEQICLQKGQVLQVGTVELVLIMAIAEMVSRKDYIPSVQLSASGILVALSNVHLEKIVTQLMELLQPSVVPHFTVPHTLGAIAATNSSASLPFIKAILAKMLPTLGMLRTDPLKQAFAYALGNFATALLDHINNENKDAGDETVKDDLSTEFSIAFDILFIHWVNSNEPKVIETILEAMGPMTNLLPIEKYEALVPKLITNIFSLYKKQNLESYFVTQALTYVLMRAVKVNNLLTSAMIDNVNATLFSMVLTLPDYDQPQKIKNHFEVLRCFDILLLSHNSFVLEFLYQRAKHVNEEEKMKSIVVLTHLLSSSDKMIAENLITISKDNINVDNMSIKMKRILLKAIVALAYRQNLQEPDNWILYEFIIRYICNTNASDMSEKDVYELFNDCESSLYLLCSTVHNIKQTLWPLLLKAFLQSKYSNSISILAKCLNQLVQAADMEENEVVLKNKLCVPTNEAVFVRCLSLLNYPHNEKMYRVVLNFLLNFCGDIHKNLAISWELDVKNHLTYLSSKDFCPSTWESMIMDLFKSAIYLVNDNSWIETVCHKIIEQIPQTESCVAQKGILYKFLATLLCNTVDPQSIEFRLDIYFNALPNCASGEEEYLAQSLGIASIRHGVKIVEKLDALCRDIDSRKSGGFLKFNFMKNPKNEASLNSLKCTLTLCYGEIARELTDFKVLERFVKTDGPGCGTLVRWLVNVLDNASSSLALVRIAVNTAFLLAKAMHSMPHNIVLQERWKLLNLVLDQMIDRNTTIAEIELFPQVIDATMALSLLPAHLVPEERNAVLRIVFNKVYNSINSLENLVDSKQLNDRVFRKLLVEIQTSLDTIIKEFVTQSTCPSTLDDILSILDEWIMHKSKEVRYSAMKSIQITLLSFIQNIKLTYENPSRFNQSGVIMGRMVSKCSDGYSSVRSIAVNCIKVLIQIVNLYDGGLIESRCEAELTKLEKEIETDDHEMLAIVYERLGDVLSSKVQHQQMLQLIESLLQGMQGEYYSGKSCLIVLNILFKTKGQDLYQNVNDVVNLTLSTARRIDPIEKEIFLQVLLTFSKHHVKSVVSYLLMQPLPFEMCVCDCWNVLARDSSISVLMVEYLLTMLESEPLFEESLKYDNEKIATVQYLSIISALCEVLNQPETEKICNDKFTELFAMLYTTLVCYIGATPPAHSILMEKKNDKFGFIPNSQSTKISPARVVVDTMKALLFNANCTKVINVLLMCSQLDSIDHLNSFLNKVHDIVAIFCKDYPHHLTKLVTCLNQYARDSLIPQRIAVSAFFGHILKFRCIDNLVMLDTVIATLNSSWRDTALEVRAISLSGLSNIKYLHKEQCESQMQSAIMNFYQGLDDQQGMNPATNIPLISMTSLNEFLLLDAVNNEHLESYSPIAHRIKAFMNTENPALREASIRLFGEIAIRQKSDAIKEQAFGLFPCFLLHLADDDVEVVKACKQTLKKVCPNIDAPNSNNMIQNHLIDSAKLHITSFITDLIKCMIAERSNYIPQLVESTMNYLSSPWENIRANSVIVIGLLFTNHDPALVKDEDFQKNVKILTFRLLQLLKDKNSTVRGSAAVALSNLYQAS